MADGVGSGGERTGTPGNPSQTAWHSHVTGLSHCFPSVSSKSVHLSQLPSISQGLNPVHRCLLFMEAWLERIRQEIFIWRNDEKGKRQRDGADCEVNSGILNIRRRCVLTAAASLLPFSLVILLRSNAHSFTSTPSPFSSSVSMALIGYSGAGTAGRRIDPHPSGKAAGWPSQIYKMFSKLC